MKLLVLAPLLLAMVSFVLTMLALFAGKDPGFMEDYHIVMFNTSMLGHNLVPTSTEGSNTPTSTASTSGGDGIGGFLSSLVSSATAAVGGAVESELAKIGDDVADKLAGELGIKEFYALHTMDMCEGDFKPNATAPKAGYNVTNCTAAMDFSYMNISSMLDEELSIGPLNISLSDLGVTQELQDKLDDLPRLFEALAVMYILAAGFSGLAILGSAAGVLLVPQAGRKIVLVDLALALLAALFLLVGSLLTTVGGKKAADEIRDKGAAIGLDAAAGDKFAAITWASFACMAASTLYWSCELFAMTRARRRGVKRGRRLQDEKYSMDSPRGGAAARG